MILLVSSSIRFLAAAALLVVFFGFQPAAIAIAGADLFADGTVLRVEINLSPADVARLRVDPRSPVHATVRCGTNVYPDVSIHLKGSVGSFRPIGKKPALTLDFSRFNTGQKFHGLRKIHLNNSVEDPGFLNEQLGGEVFRAAGLPAPRVTRAHVVLNSRDEGLYVLIEGFTEDFLAIHFRSIGPDLYEPENGRDIQAGMKRNSVKGAPSEDASALQALSRAALTPDLALRWPQLQQALDIDQFVTFMALEVILCHRDGYSIARNNFRLYHDLDTGKMVFIPHGMDQLLAKSDFPWEPAMAGTVAKALMETPQGRARYEELFPRLLTNYFRVCDLTNRVNEIVGRLRPGMERKEYQAIAREAALVNERLVARRADLERQLSAPHVMRLAFTNGLAAVSGWEPLDQPEGGKVEKIKIPEGIQALHIIAGPATMASWRTKWLLGRGRYRFEGNARVAGFRTLPYGSHHGAGLRITGSARQSGDLIDGPSWQTLAAEFQIDGTVAEVEFVLEYRASAGEAWFDVDSMKVKQLE